MEDSRDKVLHLKSLAVSWFPTYQEILIYVEQSLISKELRNNRNNRKHIPFPSYAVQNTQMTVKGSYRSLLY